MVKTCLPVQETQETQVPSLGWEDPLEKGMATRSSILAWRIPWAREPGGLQSVHEVAKSWTRLSDQHFHFFMYICVFQILCQYQLST